jgi:hypothetical protein
MTDVPDAKWLASMLRLYRECGGEMLKHKLHAGVMTSRKILNGIKTSWSKVWPKPAEIANIFVDDRSVMNVIHYADYEDEDSNLANTLERVVGLGGKNLHALQLDMPWPNVAALKNFEEHRPPVYVILQVGEVALKRVGNNINATINRLQTYGSSIDSVLLDLSMGRGKSMDAVRLRPFIQAFRDRLPHLGITVAGGLGPDTLHLAAPLVAEFPSISIDAQGQLRPSGSSKDPIDRERSERYLRSAIEMYLATVPEGHPV